jgi:hypothetical protein
MVEIRNAIIKSVSLGIEDHGFLTAYLHLDYGGTEQGFGGYCLSAPGANYGAEFIRQCLEVVGVREWEDLPGSTVRVKSEHTKAHAIGHIVKERWFNPTELFEAMQAKAA